MGRAFEIKIPATLEHYWRTYSTILYLNAIGKSCGNRSYLLCICVCVCVLYAKGLLICAHTRTKKIVVDCKGRKNFASTFYEYEYMV